jgi:hypothetical protein
MKTTKKQVITMLVNAKKTEMKATSCLGFPTCGRICQG